MIRRRSKENRAGAVLVEFALILPVLLLLLLGTIVGALGVFRFQQVAAMAREAARYAVVHGGQYASENGKALTTQQDVYNYIQPLAFGFDTSGNNAAGSNFTVTVTWDDASELPEYVVSDFGSAMKNRVHVTVNYNWNPEAYWATIPLQSTSEMLMQY
jgi:Flp pilus assembly protein TadG